MSVHISGMRPMNSSCEGHITDIWGRSPQDLLVTIKGAIYSVKGKKCTKLPIPKDLAIIPTDSWYNLWGTGDLVLASGHSEVVTIGGAKWNKIEGVPWAEWWIGENFQAESIDGISKDEFWIAGHNESSWGTPFSGFVFHVVKGRPVGLNCYDMPLMKDIWVSEYGSVVAVGGSGTILTHSASDATGWQAILDQELTGSTELVVKHFVLGDEDRFIWKTVYEEDDSEAIQELIDGISIIEDCCHRCKCKGGLRLDFYWGDEPTASIGLLDGKRIRWDKLPADAPLPEKSQAHIFRWLIERDVESARDTMIDLILDSIEAASASIPSERD